MKDCIEYEIISIVPEVPAEPEKGIVPGPVTLKENVPKLSLAETLSRSQTLIIYGGAVKLMSRLYQLAERES